MVVVVVVVVVMGPLVSVGDCGGVSSAAGLGWALVSIGLRPSFGGGSDGPASWCQCDVRPATDWSGRGRRWTGPASAAAGVRQLH